MTRAGLNPNDPELRALVMAADPEEARSAALFAARAALQVYPVAEPAVTNTVNALDIEDLPLALSNGREIAALAERLDDVYFAGLDSADGRQTPELVQLFGRARAVTSLAAALGPDPVVAALDAIYEAYTACEGDAEEFLARVKAMLRSQRVK